MSENKNAIPDFVKENLNSNTFGRIKLNLYKIISGKEDFFPDTSTIKKFVRRELRSVPELGKLYVNLLTTHLVSSIQYPNLKDIENVTELLIGLEQNPLDEIYLLEILQCPKPFLESIGVYIYCEDLLPKGHVYVITFFDEKFPEYILGRIEIRASNMFPSPMFSELKNSDWDIYDLTNYKNSFLITLSLKILQFIQKKFKKLYTVDEALIINPKTGGKYTPPEDKVLVEMIKAVILGKLNANETLVELSKIKPHSLDFCLNFPPKIVKKTVKEIEKGENLALLVYWNGKNFIMSDDYPVYLAYKSLEHNEVPVIILGDFPSNLTEKPILVGGKELIPLVQIELRPDYSSLSDELQDWMLNQKLKNRKQSEVISNLFTLFIGLNELISDPNVREREIHNFILNNPSCFDVYGSRIMSEVWLGKKYRVDLAIQYSLDEKKLQLVELERADVEIFTKKGRFKSHVTHSIQQVEDWLQWWHENPSERPKQFDISVLPQGIVVIGRSKNLSEEDKKRLLHLNSTRQVKVITYDDLLDRIESLIENLENAEIK